MKSVQNNFLASTLHEIRTPIQTILGTAELLQETQLDPEQQEYVRQIVFSADVLYALANEILDFEKIRTGSMQIEYIPCNIRTITEQIVDLLCIEAHNKGLELVTNIDCNVPAAIKGDPVRIQQILLNLIKNAVKFTHSGYVAVSVSSNTDADAKPRLLFQIIDSGIGVSDSAKELIFKEFVQADASTTRKYGGTGLGLSISSRLASLMNGTINVTDNKEGGSVFSFTLPYTEPEQGPCESEQSKRNIIPAGFRILLVDDSKVALESMRYKIRCFGNADIETAESGKEALQKLKDAHLAGRDFEVAFIDMIMPVMDGWRLSADINADITINGMKLFLMIPEGAMGGEAKMKLLDWFNGYLYKPVKMDMLEKVLTDAVADPLELPAVDNQEKPSAAAEDLQNDESSALCASILAVEDHPVNRKIITTFLTGFGATVYTAENGKEAISRIQEHPDTDIIFMDIQMPVMNGLDASAELRKRGYKGIIIACTANSDPADFKEYRNSGMNDTLVKPFKKQTLKKIITKWLGRSRADCPVRNGADKRENSRTLWDKQKLLDSIGNDESFITELLTEYKKQSDSLLDRIQIADFTADTDELRRAAHTLKGSSAAIYAVPLAQKAELLELAYKNNDSVQAGSALKDFINLYSVFVDTCKQQGFLK